MENDPNYIKELLYRWALDTITPREKDELGSILHEQPLLPELERALEQIWNEQKGQAIFSAAETDTMVDQVLLKYPQERENDLTQPVRHIPFIRKWGWVAASALIIIAVAFFLVVSDDRPAAPDRSIAGHADIPPGKNGAILTLADGSQVLLDTFKNATVAIQGGVTTKVVNGSLVYEGKGDVVAYNTMTTPKGRQFMLVLPDGTHVWLNAASSIRYPTVFTGTRRLVEITGEAYFEVTKNKKMPFLVNIGNTAEVEVLGTHFNVNAYENEESINTTLIEGSVRVQTGRRPGTILKPGQQAQIAVPAKAQVGQDTQPGINVVNSIDIDKVIAWKNDLFYFERTAFPEIMRQLERWYDIQVVYEKEVPNMEFEGKMTKDVPLSDLLIMLERYDIHFRMEGRKLIILSAGK